MIQDQVTKRAHQALRPLIATAFALVVLAGCSSDTTDDIDAAVEDVGDQVAEELDEVTEEDAEAAVEEAGDEVAEEVDDAAAEIDERSAGIAQALRDNDLESLASAVEQVDATELLGDGEFTFFAPNDEAFLELGADELADLLSEPAELSAVLQNHVVTERIDSAALGGMTDVETRSGNTLTITAGGDAVMVGDATVVNADIDVGDGVIHVIDSVLVP